MFEFVEARGTASGLFFFDRYGAPTNTTVAAKPLDTLFFGDYFLTPDAKRMKVRDYAFQNLPQLLLFRYFVVNQLFKALPIHS